MYYVPGTSTVLPVVLVPGTGGCPGTRYQVTGTLTHVTGTSTSYKCTDVIRQITFMDFEVNDMPSTCIYYMKTNGDYVFFVLVPFKHCVGAIGLLFVAESRDSKLLIALGACSLLSPLLRDNDTSSEQA